MEKIRRFIEVKGIVQGVGFRPYVYSLALKYNIVGWVNNSNKGVLIDVEGTENNVKSFIGEIKVNPPELSAIKHISVSEKEFCGYDKFQIVKTEGKIFNETYISPDYSICNKCKNEILDKNNRRYRYAFTNCTNCGPRFSIIKSLPYDREFTTMNEFTMCDKCKAEYINPLNRRFHAQPNGCVECGPTLSFLDCNGTVVKCEDNIKEAVNKLNSGKILAIKSLGGYNLCCNGKNEVAINILRSRKHRPTKPLAIMMKDINTVKKYCKVNSKEEMIITSNKRPIILLEKLENCDLPENIAPNNKRIGVMLPYTPIHYLLFEENIEVLIMTSANLSGQPIIYNDEDAVKSLKNIADFFVINNRKINMPIDDSVVIVLNSNERVMRPGRGYCPISINMDTSSNIMALGAETKNTIAISNEKDIFYTPYIGDLRNKETINRYEKYSKYICSIYDIKPKILAKDMHPDFEYGNHPLSPGEGDISIIKVQHHHSHIVSCMVENNLYKNVLGISFDGTGYGDDKKIWGSEFLICSRKDYVRVAHLKYFKLPAGESAIKEPWKIAISLLYSTFESQYEQYIPEHLSNNNCTLISKIISKNINCIDTSSMGRFFDGVSALIGFTRKVTFEGEAAIWLQNIASTNNEDYYEYEILQHDNEFLINYKSIIKGIVEDIKNNITKEIISGKFHKTIINSSIDMAEKICNKFNINKIALSGGVFQNEIIFSHIISKLENKGFEVFTHKIIPCNDSGISIGQVVIANANINIEN